MRNSAIFLAHSRKGGMEIEEQGIAISMVYPIMKTLVHTGYEIEKFSRYASFDSSLLQDVEARIAEEELERLMDAAANYTKDDHFGLHQGQIIEPADALTACSGEFPALAGQTMFCA
ncbi:AraC family transcriptional regulator [Paenibacillus thiaminolyticus]|uniref:hypothetical protein n=1 Tax=Paenibacillus thiaminolyticus TaxID=49283 RepID=UPI002350E0AA|nr:hypothetical protein [Paenibacillus thiaminolyticus]WCR24859.1 AraC family transcriptional regulator [Paenibacillus thiaminolyticus]